MRERLGLRREGSPEGPDSPSSAQGQSASFGTAKAHSKSICFSGETPLVNVAPECGGSSTLSERAHEIKEGTEAAIGEVRQVVGEVRESCSPLHVLMATQVPASELADFDE